MEGPQKNPVFGNFYLKRILMPTFGFKSIILVQLDTKFLINKPKNRGRFLFNGAPREAHSPTLLSSVYVCDK